MAGAPQAPRTLIAAAVHEAEHHIHSGEGQLRLAGATSAEPSLPAHAHAHANAVTS